MEEMILQVNHLSKSFGSHEVLRDIDFTVKKGDVSPPFYRAHGRRARRGIGIAFPKGGRQERSFML